MPSGYTTISASVVVDLDNVFALKTPEASPAANVGFRVGGADLSSRYERITDVIQEAPFNVNYKKNGTDLKTIFVYKNFSPTPTPTPSGTGTPTPTPTETLTPTATPTITPTPSALPVTSVSFSPTSGQTYNNGDSLSVTVTALNHTPVTGYQWYNWNGTGYVTAGGQTSNTYVIGNSYPGTPDDFGAYWTYYYGVILTNAAGASAIFEWEVNINKPTPTPTPTQTPTPSPLPVTSVSFSPSSGQTYNFGDSLSVSVSALNHTPVTAYQWYNWNGSGYVTAGGQTGSTYALGTSPPGTPDDFGSYWTYYYGVILTNSGGDSVIFEWEVNVNKPPPTPTPTPTRSYGS